MTMDHVHGLAVRATGTRAQDEAERFATTDGALCAESCRHLRVTADGVKRCQAFPLEPLHPSFEAAMVNGSPRAERSTDCLGAEMLFGGAE